jgi:branched-chain amino acid transport system permease protein
VFRRPNLYTSYEAETHIFPTYTQKVIAFLAIALLFLLPFSLPVINQVPIIRFLGDNDWLRPMMNVFVFAIAALGLNVLTGVAGQVSLGHAFFMGVGAVAGGVLGGEVGKQTWGWGLPIWIWLPGAGVAAALVGIIVAPVAVRLRGLYLAIVTVGLVFIGIHLGQMNWGRRIAGDPTLGREFNELDIRIWKGETPLVDVSSDGHWLWFDVTSNQKMYLFLAASMLLFVVVAKNIARSRAGRAMQAIRDRDIAAEVMGVNEFRYKLVAFGISSFIAGIGGALFATYIGRFQATQFNLTLSVTFIAILLIGGVGTVAGTLLGSFFVVLAPEFVRAFTVWLQKRGEGSGIVATAADGILTGDKKGDFGVIATGGSAPGWQLNVFDWNLVLYGVLIIVFLIFEPLGLYGIWIKFRNYWKRWPFSY